MLNVSGIELWKICAVVFSALGKIRPKYGLLQGFLVSPAIFVDDADRFLADHSTNARFQRAEYCPFPLSPELFQNYFVGYPKVPEIPVVNDSGRKVAAQKNIIYLKNIWV